MFFRHPHIQVSRSSHYTRTMTGTNDETSANPRNQERITPSTEELRQRRTDRFKGPPQPSEKGQTEQPKDTDGSSGVGE